MADAAVAFWADHADVSGDDTQVWIDRYWASQSEPHHQVLARELLALEPASVLDVGCHCGPVLSMLGAARPKLELHGVDVSEAAIVAGRTLLRDAGLTARLVVGEVPDALALWPDQCVDVAYSCYALAYVNPGLILKTLREMWRISRKAIVIFEPQVFGDERPLYLVRGLYAEWRHFYLHALGRLLPGLTAHVMETTFADNALNAIVIVKRPMVQ